MAETGDGGPEASAVMVMDFLRTVLDGNSADQILSRVSNLVHLPVTATGGRCQIRKDVRATAMNQKRVLKVPQWALSVTPIESSSRHSLKEFFRELRIPHYSLDSFFAFSDLDGRPWEIQNLLLSAARQICEVNIDKGLVPRETLDRALWTQFLCKFHGLGCDRDADGAHAALSAISTQSAVQECLCADIEEEIRYVDEAAEESSKPPIAQPTVTPWGLRQRQLATDASSHGIPWTQEEILALGTGYLSPEPNPLQIPTDATTGNTLLHAASFHGILSLVQDLVAVEGLDINAVNQDLDSPLHLAMQAGHAEIVLLLERSEANSKAENKRGETPLHWLSSIDESQLDQVCFALVTSSRLAFIFDQEDISTRTGLISPEITLLKYEGLFRLSEVGQAVLAPSLDPLDCLLECTASVIDVGGFDPSVAHAICLRLVCEPMKLAAELHLYGAFDILCGACLRIWQRLFEHEQAFTLPAPLRTAFERSKESPRVVGELMIASMGANPFLHSAIVPQPEMGRILCHGWNRHEAAVNMFHVLHMFGFTGRGDEEPWVALATTYGTTAALSTLLSFPEFSEGINKAEYTGRTPIDEALEGRQLAALELLAARGARLDLRQGRDPNHRLTPGQANYLHLLASLRTEDTAYVNHHLPPQQQLLTSLNRYLPFALSRDPKDLPEEAAIVRYPATLIEVYRRLTRSQEVVPIQAMKSAVLEYVRVLEDREDRLKRKNLPLPPFPESFRKFHFDLLLEPQKLEEKSLVIPAVTTVNCRCFTETIRQISPTDFARLTRRVSSIDDRIWTSRIDQDTELSLELDKVINDWDSQQGFGGRTFSRMIRYITSNESREDD